MPIHLRKPAQPGAIELRSVVGCKGARSRVVLLGSLRTNWFEGFVSSSQLFLIRRPRSGVVHRRPT